MRDKIVEQLKTGRIKNVISFGAKQLPAPPYIVVKPEKDAQARGRIFRIIVHFCTGQQDWLEDYIQKDIPELLDEFTSTTRHNNTLMLERSNDYNDIVIDNDDGTISMERVYLQPSLINI